MVAHTFLDRVAGLCVVSNHVCFKCWWVESSKEFVMLVVLLVGFGMTHS